MSNDDKKKMPASSIVEQIEEVQRELVAMRAYTQTYLDGRAKAGITTSTDTIRTRHQETIAKALNLLEAFKAREQSEEEEG